jgi:hypothetical protein
MISNVSDIQWKLQMSEKIKLISMSLYGNQPMYTNGAIINAQLVDEIYPGWKMRVYCSKDVTCKRKLTKLGCEVIIMGESHNHSGMFWRFLAAFDQNISRVIFRDCDSRLNVREAAAVQAWEKSGLMCHAMHDHMHHRGLPLAGGMWGIVVPCLPLELRRDIELLGTRPQKRVKDMRYLAQNVYPLVKHSVMRHSSQVLHKWTWKPFPVHPRYDGFVGQQYDDEGNQVWPNIK